MLSQASRARLGKSSAVASENSERLSNRRRHERSVPNRRQRHEQHTGISLGHLRARDLQREPGLPGSSWSRERDEACGGISEPVMQRLQVRIAAEKDRQRRGQRSAAQFIDRRVGSRRARARKQRVTGGTIQIEGRGQRAHRFDVRPAAFPPLQRADGVDRKTCNRRELLLRETRSLAERLELRAK